MSAQEELSNRIDLGFVSVYLIKPHIVCVDCQIEEAVSVDRGIKIIETIRSMAGNEPHAIIVNIGSLYTPSKEFFKFILSQRSPEKDKLMARAIVTTNPASRLDGKNFINFFKPLTPTKLFSTIEEAIEWIDPHLNQAD
ncbi:MAG TPA: hypothetical protein VK835_00855 [Bacteroidia bacterium]|jgi:hypothetical protein|nr:hypothetical protein [Bacteroidia bacterium]